MPVKSGQCGKIVIGSSDLADVRNWTFTIESNNVVYSTSSTPGHQVSVAGTKSGTVSFEMAYNTDDPIEQRIKPGEQATLLLYQDQTRFFSVPARINSVEYTTPIEEGELLGASIEAITHGAWTYPDGVVSTEIC